MNVNVYVDELLYIFSNKLYNPNITFLNYLNSFSFFHFFFFLSLIFITILNDHFSQRLLLSVFQHRCTIGKLTKINRPIISS